jgi:hypothetical protein
MHVRSRGPTRLTIPSGCLLLLLALGCPVPLASAGDPNPPSHKDQAGPPALKAQAENLTRTVITPHLEEKITGKKNVLWCSTFQLAWNEACEAMGGDLKVDNAPAMVAILNKHAAKKDDLDSASYVAMGGFVRDGIIEKIAKALASKFKGQTKPDLLPDRKSLGEGYLVAYAYLFKSLPFEHPFDRTPWPTKFLDANVATFGIEVAKKRGPRFQREATVAAQVGILDYKDGCDFIVELRTKSKGDHLLLAKIAPAATLGETIEAVRRRVDASKPHKMEGEDILRIPVLNFDLTRRYTELIGRNIGGPASDFPIIEAIQGIRFKLDEKGAVLVSEADVQAGGGPPHHMVFDAPFLIMLQREGAKAPYFALWVANAELLVPMGEAKGPVRAR